MLSPADMLVVGVAALLFFGPDQLPKVARRAGQVVRDVQATSASFIREMERAADEPDHPQPYIPREPYAAEPETLNVTPDLHIPPHVESYIPPKSGPHEAEPPEPTPPEPPPRPNPPHKAWE